MNYCINTTISNTISICKRLLNYCVDYCSSDDDSNASSNCVCDCLSNEVNYNKVCVFNKADIVALCFMIPAFLLLLCVCCKKYNTASARISNVPEYNNNLLQQDNDLPKYYEVVNVEYNTPLPLSNSNQTLPQYHQNPQQLPPSSPQPPLSSPQPPPPQYY